MNQIKYMLKDIKNNTIMSVFLLGLSVIMMLLFVNLFDVLHHTQECLDSIEPFRNTQAFIMMDHTDELQLEKVISDEKAVHKIENFIRELREEDVKFYTQFAYDMDILEDGSVCRQERVTENFFSLFGIDVVEGRLFTPEEYDEVSEVVPIVIGYNLSSEYQVGEVYDFSYAGTAEEFKGKIIGRLQKNSTYMEFNNGFELNFSLDNSYIIPLGLKDYQNEKMAFSDWDMALTSLVIFGDNVDVVKKGILNMDLFDLSLLDIQDRFDEVVKSEMNYLYLIILISSVILLSIVVIMWMVFHRLLKRQMYEYSIHLLCGAKTNTLIMRIACYIFFMLAVAIIITCILTKSINIILPLCGVTILLGVVIMLYPICKLKCFKITQIMKDV